MRHCPPPRSSARRPSRLFALTVSSLLAALALPSTDGAGDPGPPCPQSWLPTFGAQPGVDGDVHAMTRFDDGTGTSLYAGGNFRNAGSADASHVAAWDGDAWTAVGGGTDGVVYDLCVFDDGVRRRCATTLCDDVARRLLYTRADCDDCA